VGHWSVLAHSLVCLQFMCKSVPDSVSVLLLSVLNFRILSSDMGRSSVCGPSIAPIYVVFSCVLV
jgi:hypothetical protein